MEHRAHFKQRTWKGRPRGAAAWAAVVLAAATGVSALGAWAFPGREFAQPEASVDVQYLGRDTCADCHEERALQHAGSNFIGSWQPPGKLSQLTFERTVDEGGIRYAIRQESGRWLFDVKLPERPLQTFPVHSVVGGERFGHSLLVEVAEIESQPLPRKALVEARYFIEAGTGKLKLSPGFPRELPKNYATAVGRVLSPDFEEKCLNCHGGIRDTELAAAGGPHPQFVDTGVGCERCHGPGGRHLDALEAGGDDLGIVNPARLTHPQVMELCGQCHSGFSPMSHPRPADLLISNQFNALSRSQCYIQSGRELSCVSCHDPHVNARHDDPRYNQTCGQCHQPGAAAAVTCKRAPQGDCVQCHMPVVDRPGNFRLRDHWIRVVREAPAGGSATQE